MSGAINPPRTARCRRINRDLWTTASAETRREFHRERMKLRRRAQFVRVANRRHAPSGSIAGGNRHGGEHLNVREIARRARQSASPPS